MMDLIDREKAYEVLTEYYHHRMEIQHKGLREALAKAPTVEPKHGHWIKIAESGYECSACHEIQCCTSSYCGECGARMDEVME